MNDIVTVVGENTVVKGSLQGDEDLTVFGKLEGAVNLTKTLIVESSGIVVADIEVHDAIISGVVVGNISATNSVQITDEGRMVGDISSPRVIIVDGASFKGHVDMGNLEAPVGEKLPAPPRAAAQITRTTERSQVPPRRAPVAPPSRPSAVPRRPQVTKAKPKPKPKPRRKAPAKPARGKKKTTARRKPPRPPAVPSGRKKVKRRR